MNFAQYIQRLNRRHDLVGHLFQGRYEAILVHKEAYLLELTCYVVLNPLRARMVKLLDDWRWSNHLFTTGQETPPPWPDTVWLLGQFGSQRGKALDLSPICDGRQVLAQPHAGHPPPTAAG